MLKPDSSKPASTFKPYIPADKHITEVSLSAISLGVVLACVLGAANTYLGLYAGMTVSASIPAAVISMGLLRGVFRRGTILENNMVQTIASTGESLAAGVIFTIPALLITGAWDHIEFWPTTLICMTGGLLGIIFMIPLRRSHIVEDKELTFPEGVACAEVLKAGEDGGAGAKWVLVSLTLGAACKFFTSGVTLFKGSVEWAFTLGKTAFFIGSDISPALLGVGYIVGFNIAVLVFVGGIISWAIVIPIYGMTTPIEANTLDWFWTAWSTKVRYLGVGAMIVGGIWSIVAVKDSLIRGIQEAIGGYKRASQSTAVLRTDENMKSTHILFLLVTTSILVFFLYNHLIQSSFTAAIATVCMIVLSFFLSAVASYIVGLVGSSNSPVSGMTICAVMATAGFLMLFGLSGTEAMVATLGVAGVVCCATCSAGDISQDLKTGYLLGATPRKQQWMEVIGAVIPSFIMAPVLIVLSNSYGIGTGEPGSLKAPQASLFASLVQGLFGHGSIPWDFVLIGAIIGVLIIVADQVLKSRAASFRLPVMAVAVGMYLPLTLAPPILIGGIISKVVKAGQTGSGVLFASGLIAGEALVGVFIGAVIYFNPSLLPLNLLESNTLSVFALAGLSFALFAVARKKIDSAT